MITIPGLELDLLVTPIDRALSHADRGDVLGGHDELLHGRARAEAASDDGEAWVPELLGQWTWALEREAERWRIGRA